MFVAILKATNSSFQKSIPFCHSIYVTKVMELLAFIFEHPSYEGGSICNENSFITPSINALGSYAICQTKDQSVAVKMVHETLFYLSKFNKLHTS